MTPDERLDDIEAAWLKLCGSCDAGLTTACTCSDRDPRQDVNWLAERLRDARAEAQSHWNDARTYQELYEQRVDTLVKVEAGLAAARAKVQRLQAAIDAANVQLNLAFSEGWRIDHVRAALTDGDR